MSSLLRRDMKDETKRERVCMMVAWRSGGEGLGKVWLRFESMPWR
jgi:hypothetical protein